MLVSIDELHDELSLLVSHLACCIQILAHYGGLSRSSIGDFFGGRALFWLCPDCHIYNSADSCSVLQCGQILIVIVVGGG